jgi:ADP-ribosyl-[dinitrogen reductase] hydrolase
MSYAWDTVVSCREEADGGAVDRVMEVSTADRFRGCLLGGAIGDALGAPIEFHSLSEIRATYGHGGIDKFTSAYGRAGAITDDTQMTLFTAEGLLRAQSRLIEKGITDPVTVIYLSYLRWLVTQGGRVRDDPDLGSSRSGWLITNDVLHASRAPGMTCLSALRSGERGSPDDRLNNSKGCGAIMRVAPIGLIGTALADPFALAADAGALTHGHPSGYLSGGAFASIISELVNGAQLRDAIDVARSELTRWDRHEETLEAINRATTAAADGAAPTAERVESLGAGWVGEEALAIGLYCALVASDGREGLRLAVNHSGDSDSTGSIAGNLLGTMYGVDALPGDLVDGVEARDLITQVADDLARAFLDGETPDLDRYPGY